MKRPYKLRNQHGFSALHFMPVMLLIAIAFVGGSVYQAQVSKRDAARVAQEEAERKKQTELSVKKETVQDQTEVTVPSTLPEEKPVVAPAPKAPTTTTKPKQPAPTYTTVSIPTTSAVVQAEQVVLTAKLPASYSGTCKALVKLPSGENQLWFESLFGPADTCSVTVPRSKLGAGSEWKFYMYFKSSDGLTKGEGGGNMFTL